LEKESRVKTYMSQGQEALEMAGDPTVDCCRREGDSSMRSSKS